MQYQYALADVVSLTIRNVQSSIVSQQMYRIARSSAVGIRKSRISRQRQFETFSSLGEVQLSVSLIILHAFNYCSSSLFNQLPKINSINSTSYSVVSSIWNANVKKSVFLTQFKILI